MGKAPKKLKTGGMTDDDTPIGMSADGGLNIVNPDDPPWKPKVLDADGNEIDPEEIQPDAPQDE